MKKPATKAQNLSPQKGIYGGGKADSLYPP
jgi:hypothetical protein